MTVVAEIDEPETPRGLSARKGAGIGPRRLAQGRARAILIASIADAMSKQGLSQVQAARLCRTDQPTLSKVLRGRTESVTLDKLVGWLLSLGRSVEIRVAEADSLQEGTLTAVAPGATEAPSLSLQERIGE